MINFSYESISGKWTSVTRMHSSRMRTGRFNGHLYRRRGSLPEGGLPGGHLGGCLPGGVCPGGCVQGGVHPHWTQRQTPPAPLHAGILPPPCEQNDRPM